MLTFTDQQNMCKAISNLSDATSVTNFKRDLNAGTARFLAKLDRPVDRQSRFTSSVANQQYYQIPEDAIRISYVIFLTGSNVWIPLQEVPDELTWRKMNAFPQTSSQPTHFFAKGGDEFGIYPTPSISTTDGIELVYEPKHIMLTADDYTTGTVSVTNNSNSVTGTGTTFTNLMANGSYVLQITDGSDGNYYRITTYSSPTNLTLENYYQGITNATLSADAITGYSTSNSGTIYGLSISSGTLGTSALAQGAVQGNQLATSAIYLGSSTLTSDVTTTSTTVVALTGLSQTVTVPSGGRKVKISVMIPQAFGSGNIFATFSIWRGTVGSGTQIGPSMTYALNASSGVATPFWAVDTSAPSGSQTYNVGWLVNSGTGHANGSASSACTILAEVE